MSPSEHCNGMGKYNNVKKKKKNKQTHTHTHTHTSEQARFKISAFGSFSNILKRLNILKTKLTK